MNIIGILNGAVLQRNNDDVCEIIISGNFDGMPKATPGKITELENGTYKFTDIPVGGPYDVTISDDSSTVTYNNIYVGDVWLLAGQSNMQGAGRYRDKDLELRKNPNPVVRGFYMDDVWDGGKPNLHELWKSKDKAITELVGKDADADKRENPMAVDNETLEDIRGIGPGLFIGLNLYEKLGVPQGFVACAVGGASIAQWTPDDTENYYSAAIRRLKLTGSNIKGMFWYQGEGFEGSKEEYIERFEKMRNGIKEVCNMETLPTVQAQLCKCRIPIFIENENKYHYWTKMRSTQLDMEVELSTVATVSTNDYDLDDCIHLDADCQENLGKRFADAMLYLVYDIGKKQPRLSDMYVTKDINHANGSGYALHIAYDNVDGCLTSKGVPYGFLFAKDGETPSMASIQCIRLIENEVVIRFELSLAEIQSLKLHYGCGVDFYCNITDSNSRAIPSIGPLTLENVYEK